MKKGIYRVLGLFLALALVIGVLQIPAEAKAAEKKTVTILETSDIHGFLMNHNYATDTPYDGGLVQAATVIKEQRAIDPNLIYVDCGDLVQGNMISEFRSTTMPSPAVEALNALNCDAWELGNHEFNYEFASLEANIKGFKNHVLGGNIYKADGTRFVEPYFVKEVNGIKVAILGVDAPHITRWESDSSHYNNMKFTAPGDEIGKILDEIEKDVKPDVVICMAHYGEDGEYELAGTGGMYQVAKKYADRVDAFLIGHAHSVLTKYLVNGEWQDEYSKDAKTVMIETGTQCVNVGKITIDVEKDGDTCKVVDRKVENLSTLGKTPDADMVKLVKEVHEESVRLANTVVGTVAKNFYDDPMWLPGIPYSIIQDGPILDLIHKVQLKETGADVSIAALFVADSNLLKGDYKLKDGVNVYKYDNTLMACTCTGKQLKAIMEQQAGNFFNQYVEGDVTISFNPNIRMYNYDTFQGVNYEIDISQPEGSRIKNVTFKGEPLKDDQVIKLALNNYRFGGLTGSGLLDKTTQYYDSAATADVPAVRDMISQYIKDAKGVTPETDNNWKIVGADLSDPQAELVYDMVRKGEITIPTSEDGRTPNIKSLNAIELRKEGVLPALETEAAPELKLTAKAAKGKITLSWNKVDGATKYRVVQVIGKKKKIVKTLKANKLTVKKAFVKVKKAYKKQALKKGKKYKFIVRAFVNGKWTDITASATKTVKGK